MPPQVMCPDVMSRLRRERIDEILGRLVERVDRTLEQCQRFEDFAADMATFSARWPSSALARWLDVDDLDTSTLEMALVALAIKGSASAGAIIDRYDPIDRGEDHELFYQIARIEWEQRFKDSPHERHAS